MAGCSCCVSHMGPIVCTWGGKRPAVLCGPHPLWGVQVSSHEEPCAAKHKPDRQAVSKTLEAHVLMPHWLKSVTQPTQTEGVKDRDSTC